MTMRLSSLPALRRQHLMAEFAGLKQACPEAVFVSLTPGETSLWSGIMFIREGPYAPAILRFQISFPGTYPGQAPLVTFSTDMFHPLITPLTTYMYTTDTEDNGTVSATDEERLPPGGFSLRHGFPDWFGRRYRGSNAGSRQSSGQQSESRAAERTPPRYIRTALSEAGTPASGGSRIETGLPGYADTQRKDVSTYDLLRYMRSTFDDEAVLDSISLEAAGNPGAWQAWRTYRRSQGKVFEDTSTARENKSDGEGENPATPKAPAARKPGEWNWEGVWEERVKKGVAASLSDAVLYGSAGVSDDVIRFLSMEESEVESVKDNLLRTVTSP